MRFTNEYKHIGSEPRRQNVLAKMQADRATGTLEKWLNHNVRGRLKPVPPHREVLRVPQTR